jgi:hypothetical protein
MVSSLVFGSHNCLQVITKDTLEGGLIVLTNHVGIFHILDLLRRDPCRTKF